MMGKVSVFVFVAVLCAITPFSAANARQRRQSDGEERMVEGDAGVMSTEIGAMGEESSGADPTMSTMENGSEMESSGEMPKLSSGEEHEEHHEHQEESTDAPIVINDEVSSTDASFTSTEESAVTAGSASTATLFATSLMLAAAYALVA